MKRCPVWQIGHFAAADVKTIASRARKGARGANAPHMTERQDLNPADIRTRLELLKSTARPRVKNCVTAQAPAAGQRKDARGGPATSSTSLSGTQPVGHRHSSAQIHVYRW